MTDRHPRRYSDSSLNMKSSAIRDMLKYTGKPGMISFAGGLPGPEAFPVEELKEILNRVIEKHGSAPFQYGTTEGYEPLRDGICDLMNSMYETSVRRENILVTSGSQQALYLLCKILLNQGDPVITENPTYTGALSTFNSFVADIQTIDIDENGMIPEKLVEVLEMLKWEGRKPAFIYTMPEIHNPAGVTMDIFRKIKLYEIAAMYDVIIVEDDPYGMINYDDKPVIPVKYFDRDDRVVYMGSFSKTLSPGLRTGWMAAHPEIVKRCIIAKQGEDLCSNSLSQYAIYSFLAEDRLHNRIEKVRDIYRAKRDIMAESISRKIPCAQFMKPEGGLFIWAKLPAHLDTGRMLLKSLEKNVAYIAGSAFYPHGGGDSEMRLNFTFASHEEIAEGISRLGEVVNDEITMLI